MAETEHAIPFDSWEVLAGTRAGASGMIADGYGNFLALSPGVTVAAGDVVAWTATPGYNDLGDGVRGHVFLALGDDIAPDGSGTAEVLDSGVTEDDWQDTPVPLEGTAPEAGTVYAGVRGTAGRYGISGTEVLTVTAAPEPDPDPDPEDPDPEDPDPEDPDPEDPDPEDPDDALAGLVNELAPRVAAHAGHRDDEDMTELARDVLPVVVEFVGGYVRDKGMGSSGYAPERQLRAVIVSAASRLVLNPDQVRQYSTADYSETSPIFSGYSMAEIGVLHRYRKRWA